MASKLGEAFVEITGRDTGLKKAFDETKRKADAISRTRAVVHVDADTAGFQGKLANIGGMLAGMAATLGIAQMFQTAAQEAMAAEDAAMKLTTALAMTGDAAPNTIKRLEDFAAAMQKVTIAEDDDVIAGMAQMKAMGMQTAQLEAGTRAALTLAAASGMDLASAFQAVGAANNGVTRAFTRYVPGLKTAQDETQKMNMILDWGTRNFSLAEGRARTTSGAMIQFSNAVKNLYEFIGGMLLPVLAPLAQWAKGLTEWFNGLSEGTRGIVAGFAAIVGVALAVISAIAGIASALRALALAETAAAIAKWAKAHPAMAVAAATAIAGAMATAASATASAMRDAGKATDEYVKDTQKAISAAGGLTGAGSKTASAAAKEQADAQKQAAEESKKIADDAKQKRDTFAEKVMARVRALRQQREEEEKAKQAAIGWSSIGDVWKGAATAGLRQQFAQSPAFRNSPLSMLGQTGAGAEFSQKEVWDAARAEQSAERRHRELLNKIGALAQGGSL